MVNVRSLKEAESTLISLLQINQTGCLILLLRFIRSWEKENRRKNGWNINLWIRKKVPRSIQNHRAWQRLWEWHMQTWSSVITWRSLLVSIKRLLLATVWGMKGRKCWTCVIYSCAPANQKALWGWFSHYMVKRCKSHSRKKITVCSFECLISLTNGLNNTLRCNECSVRF